jgi:protein arginine N-methyltransferase 1
MAGPTRYSLANYGAMVACEPRMPAYAAALREAVTPGCTVIDIGAGPGVFSLLACQYGAGKVIAIEPDDSVELLREMARVNGFEDRITVVQGLSTAYDPPTRADVIVSDIRGCLPLFESHIASIVDARNRLLAPGGTLIPARDRLRIALVESVENHAMVAEPWMRNAFGLDLSAGHCFVANSWWKVKLDADSLLSDPAELATLDYDQVTSSDLASATELTIAKAGFAHGFAVWFDSELAPGIGFSNAPGEPPLIYGQTFLPLERPVAVGPGDRVTVEFTANLIDGGYVWGWSGGFRAGDGAASHEFRHSTFLGKVISPQSLRTRASDFTPPHRTEHDADRLCLSLIDGQRSLADIAAALRSEFPQRFQDASKALNHVVELTNRYR